MNELQFIQSKIYEIRGKKVMLDFDLAGLYGTETKRLKEAVRCNIKRLLSDFMFETTKEEFESLRTQLELINQTLAELQVQKEIANKPRNPIGFKTK